MVEGGDWHGGDSHILRWTGGRHPDRSRRLATSRGCVVSCLPAREDAGEQPHDAPGGFSPTGALDDLRDQLDDDAAVERFRENFLELLEQRIAEIARSIRTGHADESVTRLLTLETSSHMVGADELSLRAAALRLAVGHHQPNTGVLFAELTRAASAARELLSPH